MIKKFNDFLNEGKYDNNNLDEPNSVYVVEEPFTVWLMIDSKPSSYSYGSSRVYEPVYKDIVTKPGDMILNYHGGLFYKGFYSDNKMVDVKSSEPRDFSPFEKRPPQYNKFPLEKLKKVN